MAYATNLWADDVVLGGGGMFCAIEHMNFTRRSFGRHNEWILRHEAGPTGMDRSKREILVHFSFVVDFDRNIDFPRDS